MSSKTLKVAAIVCWCAFGRPPETAAASDWSIEPFRPPDDLTFEEVRAIVEQVRNVVQTSWRASSLVEGINSVVRMQQARHRRLTAGLIDLKRFYWNCRDFRTGRRKGHSETAPWRIAAIQRTRRFGEPAGRPSSGNLVSCGTLHIRVLHLRCRARP